MEQPLSREKKFFSVSPKMKEETKSFLKLAAPMFGSQVALQLIGINSVIPVSYTHLTLPTKA